MAAGVLVVSPVRLASAVPAVLVMAPVLVMATMAPVLVMAPVPRIRAPVPLPPSPMARRNGLHGGCRPWRDGGGDDPRDRHCGRGGRARGQNDLRSLRMRRPMGSSCVVGRVGHRADIGADGAPEGR
jgi:hypothetical protein